VTLTVNEGGTASFQCSVSGNPDPTVVWSRLNNQSEVTQSAVLGGKLELFVGRHAGFMKSLKSTSFFKCTRAMSLSNVPLL